MKNLTRDMTILLLIVVGVFIYVHFFMAKPVTVETKTDTYTSSIQYSKKDMWVGAETKNSDTYTDYKLELKDGNKTVYASKGNCIGKCYHHGETISYNELPQKDLKAIITFDNGESAEFTVALPYKGKNK